MMTNAMDNGPDLLVSAKHTAIWLSNIGMA
jgi:hypothetical protein